MLASEQANTGDNAAAENITSTQAPSSSGRYTDDAGNIYRYSIINDGAAVSIDGKSLIKSTEIVLPSYIEGLPVETVDGNVIRNTNVTSITLPETCKKTYGFLNNTTIETVTLNEGLEIIESHCFEGCTSLTSINIPSSIAIIDEDTFSHCTKLKNITFEYSTGILSLGSSAFQFTAVTADTLNTNKRKYTDQQNPFANTALDPEYAPSETILPSGSPEPEETPVPSASAQPTEIPEAGGELDVSVNNGEVLISVNGSPVTFPDEKPFSDSNDRTQIPVRAVAEAFDCNVDWNGDIQTVTITKDDRLIVLNIGNKNMQVDKEIITMDTEAQIINDRTYIPIRFVGEALNMKVNWDNR